MAVDYEKLKVYMCVDKPDETNVRVSSGQKEVTYYTSSYIDNENSVEIEEAEFAAKFSAIAAKLHSQTPYA
jgi:hypothetical protein